MKKVIILVFTFVLLLSSCTNTSKLGNINKPADRTITLYFRDNSLKLIREKRTIKLVAGESLEKRVLEELIKGPDTKSLYPTVSKQTKVINIKVNNGAAVVDLSEEFVNKYIGGSEVEYLAVYSVVDTLTELININKVKFLIDGKPRKFFQHMELDAVFERDESVIKNAS